MPLTSTIRQAIALSGGTVEQMGGGCEVLRLPWGDESFIRISSRDDTLVLPETLDGEPVSIGVYWNADDEDSLQEDLCCNFDSLREALLGTIPGTTVLLVQPNSVRAAIAKLPSDACPVGDPQCVVGFIGDHSCCEPREPEEAPAPVIQTTETRANRIEQFLEYTPPYNEEDREYRDAVTELLSDIRHFCDRWDIDFGAVDRLAYRNYIEEKGR